MTEQTSRGRQAAQTKSAIVAAFLTHFARRGISNTSIDQVAREAGVTKGAIYWHFVNKDAIFAAIMDSVAADWDASILQSSAADLPTAVRLQRFFAAFSAFFERAPESCLFLQRALIEGDPRHAAEANRIYKRTARAIQNLLDDGRARGDCRTSVDTDRVAHLLLASLLGTLQLHGIDLNVTVADTLEEVRRLVLARILA